MFRVIYEDFIPKLEGKLCGLNITGWLIGVEIDLKRK